MNTYKFFNKEIKLIDRIAILEDVNDLENYLLKNQKIIAPNTDKEIYIKNVEGIIGLMKNNNIKTCHITGEEDFLDFFIECHSNYYVLHKAKVNYIFPESILN